MKNLLELALNHIIITLILVLIIIILTGYIKYKYFILHSSSVDFGSHGFHESERHWNWKYAIALIKDILIFIITFLLLVHSFASKNLFSVISTTVFIILFIFIFSFTSSRSKYHP